MAETDSKRSDSERLASLEVEMAGVRHALDDIMTKLSSYGKTNYTMLGLVVAIIFPVVGALYWPVNQRLDLLDREDAKMDIRLQREMRDLDGQTDEKIKALDAVSSHRHESAMDTIKNNSARLDRVEEWVDGQARDDLQDLRAMRRK